MPSTLTPTVLAEAEPASFDYLRAHSSVVRVPKGEIAIQPGELGAHNLIVGSGLLMAEVPYPDEKFIPAQFIPPGRGFAPSHSPTAPSVFRISALADAEVVFVPNSVLFSACAQFPLFAQGMVASLLERTNDGYLGHARVRHMPLETQIAYLFWWLALLQPRLAPNTKLLPWKLPQRVLADFFGVPREEVSRKLGVLENLSHLKKLADGYVLYDSLELVFSEYGSPSAPVSFIKSGLTVKRES